MQSNFELQRANHRRRCWADMLAEHGINRKRLLAGKIRDDKLASAAKEAGFPEAVIAKMVQEFNSEPGTLPPPEMVDARSDFVSLLAQRAQRKLALRHPDDQILSDVDDHLGQTPEGKPKQRGWIDREADAIDAAAAEAAQALDGWTVDAELREWRKRHREASGEEDHPAARSAFEVRQLAVAN